MEPINWPRWQSTLKQKQKKQKNKKTKTKKKVKKIQIKKTYQYWLSSWSINGFHGLLEERHFRKHGLLGKRCFGREFRLIVDVVN